MSTIKVRYWLDSGANIHSKRERTTEVDKEEWDELSEKDKDDMMKELAWDAMDWGYCEVET